MIHPAIEQHIPAIRDLCREYGVRKLELFGSAVDGRFDPARSDVDFLVTYPQGYEFGPWGQRVFELQDALAGIVGRNVDLVMSDAPRNPRFIERLNQSRLEIFREPSVSSVA
jgi:predicted nucleotidyltransferase